MSTTTESLLKDWGFEKYLDIFKENEVDIDALQLLDDVQVRALIPTIGPQAKFKKALSGWKESLGKTGRPELNEDLNRMIHTYGEPVNGLTTSPSILLASPSLSSVSSLTVSSYPQSDLTLLLQSTPDGQILLKQDPEKPLGEQYRKILTRIISNEILKEDPKAQIKSATYLSWLQEISKLFPLENLESYYTQPRVGLHRAHGRLSDGVSNLKAKYRKHRVYEPRARRSLEKTPAFTSAAATSAHTSSASTSSASSSAASTSNITEEEEECLEWLRCSSDDYAVCVQKWQITNQQRKQRVISNEKVSYHQEFPCLKRSWGYSLLIADFDHWYPENQNSLDDKIPLLKSKLLNLSRNSSTRSPFVEELKQLAQDQNPDTSNLALFLLLPHMIGPVQFKRKRISAAEVRQSFISHVEDETKVLEERLKRQASSSCYACRPRRNVDDFQRELSQGDIGITVYRLRETPLGERRFSASRGPKETIIFYTKRNIDFATMSLDIFYAELPKCVNYCARCKELLRRIERLFQAGTTRCGGLCQLFSCPPCTDIVRKFQQFTQDTSLCKRDSELIHLERLTSPQYGEEDKLRRVFDDAKAKLGVEEKTTGAARGLIGEGAGRKTRVQKEEGIKAKAQKEEGNEGKGLEAERKLGEVKIGERKKPDGKKKERSPPKAPKTSPKGPRGKSTSPKTPANAKLKKKTERPCLLETKPTQEIVFKDVESHASAKLAAAAEKMASHLSPGILKPELTLSYQESDDSVHVCDQEEEEAHEIIIGEKIYPLQERQDPSVQSDQLDTSPKRSSKSAFLLLPRKAAAKSSVTTPHPQDGVLRYALSDPKYIANGYTQLPKEMLLRKVAVFAMRPSWVATDWLRMHNYSSRTCYDTGQTLATCDENAYTRLYYRNGCLALEYYETKTPDTEEDWSAYRAEWQWQQKPGENHAHRIVVYSSGEPLCGRARPHTVLAAFDFWGHGVVYDHTGRTRLLYTQNEGIVLDRAIGQHTHWKWHNLNGTALTNTIIIEKQLDFKDPVILTLGNQEPEIDPVEDIFKITDERMMKNIEAKKLSKENKHYIPYQIKMKAFKINEYFSLRIVEQSSIFLTFTDGRTRLKMNVGMVLDPSAVVGEEFVQAGVVDNVVEKTPAVSESVERLHGVVLRARRAERARVLHERLMNR